MQQIMSSYIWCLFFKTNLIKVTIVHHMHQHVPFVSTSQYKMALLDNKMFMLTIFSLSLPSHTDLQPFFQT